MLCRKSGNPDATSFSSLHALTYRGQTGQDKVIAGYQVSQGESLGLPCRADALIDVMEGRFHAQPSGLVAYECGLLAPEQRWSV